ncbi:3'-5' exoribonuclease [Nonomuraea sp. NPDC004580]|uniref:3'-5' exoribonuclease domain-containing protein n=1 Tax=Nonomuraea sp. NPDC004580 TaxID=3154552 RepID=UPI0033BBEBE1
MKIFYDTEFIEDGKTIDLISIGMVAEDGRELYAVSCEFSFSALQRNDWLMANVAPSLPIKPALDGGPWDREHPDYRHVHPRAEIARKVERFIRATPDPELWAWYAAYDHVALCQLFGRMIDLPDGVPMWTNDLKQEAERLGNPRMPRQAEGEHNALADARHNQLMHDFLIVERRRADGGAR